MMNFMSNMISSLSTKNSSNERVVNSSTKIGKGAIIEGNLKTEGNVRIEGEIIGDVISELKVAIGDQGILKGNLLAKDAEIEGKVTGILTIRDSLLLKPKCLIKGDIFTNKLLVEEGAKLDGQCKTNEDISENDLAKNSEKIRKK